jgi:hypothetical protein
MDLVKEAGGGAVGGWGNLITMLKNLIFGKLKESPAEAQPPEPEDPTAGWGMREWLRRMPALFRNYLMRPRAMFSPPEVEEYYKAGLGDPRELSALPDMAKFMRGLRVRDRMATSMLRGDEMDTGLGTDIQLQPDAPTEMANMPGRVSTDPTTYL